MPSRTISEPIGLRREQFGLVAATAILVAIIPTMFSIAPPFHIVKIDVGTAAPAVGRNPILVEVMENGAVTVAGKPVALLQLSRIAKEAASQGRGILIKPDACAPYVVVVEATSVLARTNRQFAFAAPDYQTDFGKSGLSGANQYAQHEFMLSSTKLRAERANLWRARPVSTITFDDECSSRLIRSAEANRPPKRHQPSPVRHRPALRC